MKAILMILFILAAGCLAIYAGRVCLFASRKSRNSETPSRKEKQEIALERLAAIWTQDEAVGAPHEQTENDAKKEEEPEKKQERSPESDTISFRNPDLNAFYMKNVHDKPGFPPHVRQIIEGLLEILDAEGDCPSVVNSHGEIEVNLETGVYNRLAKIVLREHALDTAEEMLRLIDPGPMTPMAIIAALGHDLGKIPAYRQQLYSLGDHPIISVTVMDKIPGFAEFPNRGDIAVAIRDHHRKPLDFFSIRLKDADQEARKKELAKSFSLDTHEITEESQKNEAEKPRHTASAGREMTSYGDADNIPENKKKRKPREVELPWFDGKAVLQEIAERINKVDEGRWDAFSMANGYVYIQVGLLWSIAKKVARANDDVSVLIGDSDEELRANILYSIVERLRTEENAIARGLIRDGYFSAQFVVTMRDGMVHPKASYIPFNLEAFGVLPSELESRKYGKVKEIVDITPKWET